ncbi:SRPBCC family protein [Sandarakinorhabdus oryzae]|uniref:SRPBCC family protein n=1 Tax=Sandarakinorhabdus oryzae TaxID=2675220 RepID=UPI0012E2F8C6|nr:SRPBCC domain-containing protein [Sandarakinorhabdus oryzae]
MKALLIAAALLAAPALAAPMTGDVHNAPLPANVVDSSFVAPDGSRTLQLSMVIKAPVAVLWKAFVDAGEFQKWSAPVAAIDLRTGGSIEASYDPKKPIGDPDNIRHRILTYLPERLLVFQNVQAPSGLKGREALARVVAVLEFTPLKPGVTRVQLSQTGWGDDPASNGLYGFFQRGNAQVLAHMNATYGGKGGAK